MADFTLVIGNKNWSSWSLRAWLMLKRTGADFDEVMVGLRRPETRADILVHSPSGWVPVLKHSVLLCKASVFANFSFSRLDRMNNLLRHHT